MATLSSIKLPVTEYNLLLMNLRSLMKKSGLNEAELSRRTHIPQATLHKILAGKTEDPRASTLKTLSDFFNVSIDALLSDNPMLAAEKSIATTAQSIPLISWEACIRANQVIAKLTPSNWEKWVVSEFFSDHAFALSSKPSMTPRFPKNSILFIDPDITPKDGDYVVVLYPNTDEATLREFSIDGPTKLLLPLNTNSSATHWDNKVKIIGVLVKSSFSY